MIKALLDMKGEALGDTKAQPLTLGMLERLEGTYALRTHAAPLLPRLQQRAWLKCAREPE